MVISSKILNNLEMNRSINPSLELARINYDSNKRLQTVNHNNIMRELKRKKLSTTGELLRYNQECAQNKISYDNEVKKINNKKQYGYIVVNYNNSMLFDLATMQTLDRKRVYKKDSTGYESLREKLIVIDQDIDTTDISKSSSTISKNLLYLREIAYLYFKYSKKANKHNFKEFIEEFNKQSKNKYITEDSLYRLYNYLNRKGIIESYDINGAINDIFNISKKVYEKRINNSN